MTLDSIHSFMVYFRVGHDTIGVKYIVSDSLVG